MRTLIVLILLVLNSALAERMIDLVTVADGLQFEEKTNIADDYIRLTLIEPNYQTAYQINKSVTEFLGPGMVQIQSKELILIQAPRDAGKRVEFIAVLLEMDIPNTVAPQ